MWSKNNAYPKYGYATFRAQINIPKPGIFYAVKISEVHLASTVWVDGELLARNGKVGTSHDAEVPDVRPVNIIFNAKSDTVEIVIQASNHEDHFTGMLRPVDFGTAAQIMRNEADIISQGLFIFGCILMMGFFHITLYFCRRNDISPLLFGLFCVAISPRSIITGDRAIHLVFENISYMAGLRLEYLSAGAGAFLMLYVHRLFPQESTRLFIKIFVILSAVYAAASLTAPIFVLTRMFIAYEVLIIMALIDLISITVCHSAADAKGRFCCCSALCYFLVPLSMMYYTETWLSAPALSFR